MITWTGPQWIMFACFTVAGLAGLGLIVLTIRARRRRRVPRHGWMTINERRALAGLPRVEAVPFNPPPGWDDPHNGVPVDDEWVRAHLLPGPGSLTTLREQGEAPESLITITFDDLVDPDVRAELVDALAEPITDFEIAMEPLMRKARLWALQGEESYAAAALRRWRIDEPTGEMPLYQRPDAERLAEALLVAV